MHLQLQIAILFNDGLEGKSCDLFFVSELFIDDLGRVECMI